VTPSDKVIIQSVKLTDTGRVYTGTVQGTGIRFGGVESKGLGVLQTNTPTIFIKGGGLWSGQGKITTGQLYRNLPSTPFNVGGTQGSVGQTLVYGQTSFITEAGKFRSFSQDFTTPTYQGSQATFFKPVGSKVDFFVGGKAKPIYKTTFDKDGFSYAPSGRFEVSQPTIFGREINLVGLGKDSGTGMGGFKVSKFTPPAGGTSKAPPLPTPDISVGGVGSGVTTGAGVKQALILQQTQTGGFSGGAIQTQTLSLGKTVSAPTFVPSLVSEQTIAQTKDITIPRLTTGPQQIMLQKETELFKPRFADLFKTETMAQTKRSVGGTTIGQKIYQPLTQTQTMLGTLTMTQSKLLKEQQQRLVGTGLTRIGYGTGVGIGKGFGSPLVPFPFLFPRPFGADAGGRLGKIKASRTYRYTPSFGALALKGQAFKVGALSTKKFTGLEFRGAKPKTTKTKKTTKSKRRKK